MVYQRYSFSKQIPMFQLARVVRSFFRQHARLTETLITIVLSVGICPMVSAEDHLTRQGTAVQTQRKNQQPITEGLMATLKRLEQELNQQQEILKTAHTDRERRLVQAHIEFLEKEQRALRQLLDLLAEPQSNIRQTGQEHQQELRGDRLQQQLERRQQVPPRR